MERTTTREKKQANQVNARLLKLLTLDTSAPLSVLVAIVIMGLLVAIVSFFGVPNPNMILIAGLVVCSAFLGYKGSIPAGLIMLGYTLYFFSTGHDFVTFTGENVQKVIVSIIGIVVVAFFVSYLKHIVSSTLDEMHNLAQALEEDNILLEEASASDTLTGTRNRFGLRRDFSSYIDKSLYVMMIDIDNFKKLNDSFGHDGGDRALSQFGQKLHECCVNDNIYRYGGDEFLVIFINSDSRAFNEKMSSLKEAIASIEIQGTVSHVEFSAGFVYGTPSSQGDLRLMIRQADMNLYVSKDSGRNLITGGKFSRTIAESAKPRRAHVTERA